jgi:Fe-S-cluster-containing dehydrogenase component
LTVLTPFGKNGYFLSAIVFKSRFCYDLVEDSKQRHCVKSCREIKSVWSKQENGNGFENLEGSWREREDNGESVKEEKMKKKNDKLLRNEGFAEKNELTIRTCLDERLLSVNSNKVFDVTVWLNCFNPNKT